MTSQLVHCLPKCCLGTTLGAERLMFDTCSPLFLLVTARTHALARVASVLVRTEELVNFLPSLQFTCGQNAKQLFLGERLLSRLPSSLRSCRCCRRTKNVLSAEPQKASGEASRRMGRRTEIAARDERPRRQNFIPRAYNTASYAGYLP